MYNIITHMVTPLPHADFCIEIDYEKNSPNPSRVFRAMSDLIEALESLDATLIQPLNVRLEPVLLLEDIEAGSVKTWIAQKVQATLESVDDEVLASGDYKKVVASYLVKGKRSVVHFLANKTEISSGKDIEPLEDQIFQLGEEAYISQLLPHHQPVSRQRLLNDINKINSALSPLTDKDKATFIDQDGHSEDFNLTLSVAPETIDDILTREVITHPLLPMILKIKKPDFLGDSQWEFRFDNRPFIAKIAHEEWLTKYRAGEIPLVPGDALKGNVQTEVRYGFEGEVIEQHHAVVEVLEEIRPKRPSQATLNLDGGK
ncbi:MAG: hypothetical protein ACR2HX_19445 [Pyrinomonadaceae bacterium]